MITAGYLAVAVTVLLAIGAAELGRRMPPAAAACLLTAVALGIAICDIWVLTWIAATWAAGLPKVAQMGGWSSEQLRQDAALPTGVGALCAILAISAAGHGLYVAIRRLRDIRELRSWARAHGAPGSLVVLEAEHVEAFATPGAAGRIVVTTGLLRRLPATERRALLAHEASHLAHGHTWWTLAAQVAAAANPLLRPVARNIAAAMERWADEDAAQATNRLVVARTLARTALMTQPENPAAVSTAGTGRLLDQRGSDVPARVRALLAPPPRWRALPCLALAGLLVMAAVGAGTAERRGDGILDRASTAAHHSKDHGAHSQK